jgi:lipid II:glycine glycyltransferase (peptidoglycan interpeptide bridge formation enzyme)
VLLKQLYTTKIKTPLFSLSFFEQLYAKPNGRFILVELNGEIIGGTVCVELPKKCLYEWFVCGRDGEWKSIFPSSLATYAGIRYAAEHGCSRFDMMGAGKPDEAYGVRDFKARFGGEQVEHGRFLCVRKPLLYWIGKLGVKLLKKR